MAIVVGYIPTPEGRAALARAAKESLLRQLPLVVVDSHRGGRSFGAEDAVRLEREMNDVRSRLDAAGVQHEVRTLVRDNEPTEDLLEVAEEVGAELLVIGLRRRSPVGKLLLGSNAQSILLRAECPVLAVRAEPDS